DYLGNAGINEQSNDGVLFLDSRVRIVDVKDGTSQTLLAGERPPSADFRYGWWYAGIGRDQNGSLDHVLGAREINQSIAGAYLRLCPAGPFSFARPDPNDLCAAFHYWSFHPGGANFALVDGSVHFLRYSANNILPALATRAGGEQVQF